MQKKTIKEDTKREDFFITSVERCKAWITNNTKIFVISVIVVIALALTGWAYVYYLSSKNERIQYALSGAIKDYQEYMVSKKAESLPKAEATFKTVEKDSSGGVRDVAKLYLARIDILKGNSQEAKKIYDQIVKNPASKLTQRLAEASLKEIPQSK
jgi:hypothetical protein